MEDRETARMRKYGESKTTRIMMSTVPHVISGLGLTKFQANGFLLTRVYVVKTFVSHVTNIYWNTVEIVISSLKGLDIQRRYKRGLASQLASRLGKLMQFN